MRRRRTAHLASGAGHVAQEISPTDDELQPQPPAEKTHRVIRDLPYGDDDHHRLDVHLPVVRRHAARPVLVFLHGGGFVAGDKRGMSSTEHDNIGRFAAESGFIGVMMNYRLAPAVTHPSGAEDVGRAVAFLAGRIADYGGAPRQIVLMGHSAGAAHVATFLATPTLRNATTGVVGAILSSGIFDPGDLAPGAFASYYGADRRQRTNASSIEGLLESGVPLLVSIAEFDPPELHDQTVRLLAAAVQATGEFPATLYGVGHDHFSMIAQIGTDEHTIGDGIVDFITAITQFHECAPASACLG
ncbi:alpha/beta hydrolase [Pseudonocardia sp. SCN 73-27]|uniref:alpha/beta hydrolase n=1 Tax=Pseudonocardia sp. SCN 73-27 TaxID=1660132 RepID=UPI0025E72E24|nr:alpha/beta hydrolase [Pseudonocardia sp. SCN 73-27]